MRQVVVLCALLPLLVGSGDVAPAQDVAPEVRAELVRLDAVITDSLGNPVRDLSGTDFVLLEDGKPQRLTHFLFVGRATASAPTTPAALPPALASGVAQGPGRTIVLVVDDLHIAPNNLQFTKPALLRFVAETVQPDDHVALIPTGSPGGVRQLTTDRAELEKAIQALTSREALVGPARGSSMTPAQAEMLLRGDQTALRLAARALIAEPGSVYDAGPRAAVEGEGAGGVAGAGGVNDDSKERAAAREAQRQAEPILAEATRFSRATLDTVADVVRSIADLPGRKICLVVSDGFLLGTGTRSDQTRAFRGVIDAATRSGTVVYALDSRGLALSGGDASAAGSGVPPGLQGNVDRKAVQLFRETLSALASDTGGFLVHGTNEPTPGLRRMLADNEAYYLMAYEPANTKRDGRFRRIELRVPGRPGLSVRTRTGYFAPDDKKRAAKPDEREAAPAGLREAEARAALATPLPAAGIPVRLTVDYLDLPPAGPQAVVRAHVDVTGLPWREAEGRRRADVDLVGGVFDASGALVGPPFARHVALDLTPAQQERARMAGLQFQQRVLVQPGRLDVRLAVVGANLTALGGASQSVEIPNLGDQKLTLSSVFLSSTAAPAGGVGAPDGAGVEETLRDVQVVRRFKRDESLYFQLYVYNVVPDASGALDVVLQAQIRSGDKLIAASKPQPVTFQQKDGVPLPQSNGMSLEGFEPGRYELRVVVVDRRANATAFRSVDFTVE